MESILELGCYVVGSLQRKTFANINDVFRLHLLQINHCDGDSKKEELKKMNYNLDEVIDLESKLVLITGNKAEYKEKFNFFLNVSCNFASFGKHLNNV